MTASPSRPASMRRNSAGKISTCSNRPQAGQGVKSERLNTSPIRGVMQLLQETSGVFMGQMGYGMGLLFIDHPSVANAVVQSLFFIIKRSHDVTDQANHPAQNFRQTASATACEADRSALCRDHFQTASHFPRRRAIFRKEES